MKIPSQNEKTISMCHLGRLRMRMQSLRPRDRRRSSVTRLLFRGTNDCSERISREHYMSKSVLDQLGNTLRVTGMPLLNPGFYQNGDRQYVVGLFSRWQRFRRRLPRCVSSAPCTARKLAISARRSGRRNMPLRQRARGHDRANADGFWHPGRRRSVVCLGTSTRRCRRHPRCVGAHPFRRAHAA